MGWCEFIHVVCRNIFVYLALVALTVYPNALPVLCFCKSAGCVCAPARRLHANGNASYCSTLEQMTNSPIAFMFWADGSLMHRPS